jgi:1,4-alpha-glucan branching enzyme
MPGDRWQQLANVRAYLAFMWAHPGKQLLFAGTEFAQAAEWSEQRGLDWWHLDDPAHRGVFRLVQDMNSVYRATPALYTRDHDPGGFSWMVADDRDHNVIAFARYTPDGTPLVCACNFAGIPWEDYELPLPMAGEWREVLNTDATDYGGSGVGNMGVVTAWPEGRNWQPAHARLRLPPLGALWLTPELTPRLTP